MPRSRLIAEKVRTRQERAREIWPALNTRAFEVSNPERTFVIHPYYTGRDKGCICEPPDENHVSSGTPLMFSSPGHAWWYVFHKVQPDDQRAMNNYRVITLKQYWEEM